MCACPPARPPSLPRPRPGLSPNLVKTRRSLVSCLDRKGTSAPPSDDPEDCVCGEILNVILSLQCLAQNKSDFFNLQVEGEKCPGKKKKNRNHHLNSFASQSHDHSLADGVGVESVGKVRFVIAASFDRSDPKPLRAIIRLLSYARPRPGLQKTPRRRVVALR